MIVLDTDHLNVLKYPGSPQYVTFTTQLSASVDQDFVTTAISVEEQMRGWLALINRADTVHQQVPAYQELVRLFDFFARWSILPFDDEAAGTFEDLRAQRIRIGTMDLKIASIAFVQNGLLLSANLRDFQQVPNLRVEDWIH